MKYFIQINQRAVVENNLSLDITDLALFDCIYNFFNCNYDKKMTFVVDGVEYTEINPKLIEREMPLLKFTTARSFRNRMAKLINAKLINRYQNNSIEGKSGYSKGENWSLLVFGGGKNNSEGRKEISSGVGKKFPGGRKEISHNNNTNYNSTIDNISSKEKNKKEIFLDRLSAVKSELMAEENQLWRERIQMNHGITDFPEAIAAFGDYLIEQAREDFINEDISEIKRYFGNVAEKFKGKAWNIKKIKSEYADQTRKHKDGNTDTYDFFGNQHECPREAPPRPDSDYDWIDGKWKQMV